jgi:hypothetical protein
MNRFKFFLLIPAFILCNFVSAQNFNPPFFVFEDGLWNAKSDSPEYWADLVKTSGFDGVELIGLDKLDGMLPELKRTTSGFSRFTFKSTLKKNNHTTRD